MSEIVEVTEYIAAARETIWPYLTDPTQYARWMGTDVTIEATPGGVYDVFMRDGVRASGTFLEVEAPHRVVFTWGWDHDPVVT